MATRPRQRPQVNFSAGSGRRVFGQSMGVVISIAAHAAVFAAFAIGWFPVAPIDASQIEQIHVDFVEMADDTKIDKGIQTAALVEEAPVPKPPEKVVEEAPPLPKPEPTPEPDPPPPLPPPPAPAPEPPPPDPAPQPDVAPPPEAAPAPEPTPAPEAPPPPEQTVAPPKDVPLPRIRPARPQKPVETADTSPSDLDQIQALLDKRKLEQMASAEPEPPTPEKEPTVGSATGSASVVKMTANELDALRARLAQCWNPPLGWTDPSQVRVVLMLQLNQDGTVGGTSVVESPQGQYSNTAPESALRAVRRCAPFDLPAEKYDAWKQVKVTFDPKDMG